jgi:glycosyltransferase involved in cell wall biosynthesis
VRIALNAQLLSRAHTFRSGGINRVIHHLLLELARDPRGHELHAFVPIAPPGDDPLNRGGLTFHPSGATTERPGLRIAWEQSALPRRLARLQPDLLHGLAYALPLGWAGPCVVSIYDLSFLRFPRAFNLANRVYLAASTRAAARRARQVLTISQHSRRDIVRLLGVPEHRVVVTYPAANARFRPLAAEQVAAFRARRALPDPFVFAVGTLEPRKNLAGLLEAYARLARPRPPLYIGGGAGWRFSHIFDTVQRLGLAGDIEFLGFVPEEELPLWYNAARVFVFPSLYEGFGLPVLEAMACGTPVITSTTSSLPEVAGKATALVSPDDPAALAEAMRRVLDDPRLCQEMRTAGLIQATRFTWGGLADGTVAAYAAAVPAAREAPTWS